MEPKDMTIEQLIIWDGIYSGIGEEILKRFKSLRKENEELRKDKERINWLILNRTIIGRTRVDADMERAKESEASHE